MNAETTALAPTETDAGSLIQIISRAASDPTVDIDKMQQLLAMKERIDARNAEIEFNAAMKSCQSEIPAIYRDRENTHTRSYYATLDAVNNKIIPVYTRHGFSLSFGTCDSKFEGWVRLTCRVSHVGGHSRDYQADLPLDGAGSQGKANKTGVQAFGSTVSYGRRYLTLLIFNVTLTNEDTDGRTPGEAPDAEPTAPKVAPRAERKQQSPELIERGKKLQGLINLYKANCDEGKATQADFIAWAGRALKTDADLSQLSNWTDAMIATATEACR